MREFFKGRSEYVLVLGALGLICLTVLIALDKLTVEQIAAAAVALSVPQMIAIYLVAVRASKAKDAAADVQDRIGPAEGIPVPQAKPTPPPATGGVAPLLLFLLLPFVAGCGSPSSAYVKADRATYNAVGPAHVAYLERDASLSAESKQTRKDTVASWRIRIEEAEAALAESGEAADPIKPSAGARP